MRSQATDMLALPSPSNPAATSRGRLARASASRSDCRRRVCAEGAPRGCHPAGPVSSWPAGTVGTVNGCVRQRHAEGIGTGPRFMMCSGSHSIGGSACARAVPPRLQHATTRASKGCRGEFISGDLHDICRGKFLETSARARGPSGRMTTPKPRRRFRQRTPQPTPNPPRPLATHAARSTARDQGMFSGS